MQLHFYADQACTQPDSAGLFWRGVQNTEVGGDSVVVERAWLRWRAQWGGSTFRVVGWDESKPIGEADTRIDYWGIPAQCRSVTAEGRREHPGVVIDVSLIQLAK